MGSRPDVAPQIHDLVGVDEAPYVVVGALGHDDLVHLRSLSAIFEISASRRTTPLDMAGQLDNSACPSRSKTIRMFDLLKPLDPFEPYRSSFQLRVMDRAHGPDQVGALLRVQPVACTVTESTGASSRG